VRKLSLILILLLFPVGILHAQTRRGVRKPRISESQTLLKKERVEKFVTISEIHKAVIRGLLYPIPAAGVSYVVDSLPTERRFCRPYSLSFIQDFADEMLDSLGKRLLVTSCIRDVTAQARLRRISKTAGATKGKNSTAHYTGAAIDVSFRSVDLFTGKFVQLSFKERRIVTSALSRLKKKGLLVFGVESAKNHWHVVVSKKYRPPHEKTVGFNPIDFYNSLLLNTPR